ncbi:MAG: kinase [Gammaproteobacteria bacterium]|nr:MAG: kinase [Gammaproteobacteria bacterium]
MNEQDNEQDSKRDSKQNRNRTVDSDSEPGPGWRRWRDAIIDPQPRPELEELLHARREGLPVLWLLGLTGAGKTSVIQRLTGDSRAEIGNGFEPCTRSTMFYEHPQDMPLMRFLDTRGLGEAGYDPRDDLDVARRGSHAALVLTRVDEPGQKPLLDALAALGKAKMPIIHVHTALHSLDDTMRERAIAHQRRQVGEALNRDDIPEVAIDLTDPDDGFENPDVGLDALIDAIVDLVPELEQALHHEHGSDREQAVFQLHRNEVLAYASAAAAADVLPAVGLVSVPVLQGKLLHALAGRYDMPWNRRTATEFVTTLGASFLYRYTLSLLGRQLAKFVPGVGQTLGAAAAASISFASTWALGRTACFHFHRRRENRPATREELQTVFRESFERQRHDGANANANAGANAGAGDEST